MKTEGIFHVDVKLTNLDEPIDGSEERGADELSFLQREAGQFVVDMRTGQLQWTA